MVMRGWMTRCKLSRTGQLTGIWRRKRHPTLRLADKSTGDRSNRRFGLAAGQACVWQARYSVNHSARTCIFGVDPPAGDCWGFLRRALALAPTLAAAYNNLGNALKALGQAEPAAASYRQAMALSPGLVEAHLGLGNALKASRCWASRCSLFANRVWAMKSSFAATPRCSNDSV